MKKLINESVVEFGLESDRFRRHLLLGDFIDFSPVDTFSWT
jgi:hypothetical protein